MRKKLNLIEEEIKDPKSLVMRKKKEHMIRQVLDTYENKRIERSASPNKSPDAVS